MTPRLAIRLTVIASCALTLAACGNPLSTSEQDKVRNVVNQFVKAGNDRDFKKVCDLLTLQSRMAHGAQDCAKQFAAAAPKTKGTTTLNIQDVRISGTQAAVDAEVKRAGVPHGSLQQLLLQKQNGRWLIATAQ